MYCNREHGAKQRRSRKDNCLEFWHWCPTETGLPRDANMYATSKSLTTALVTSASDGYGIVFTYLPQLWNACFWTFHDNEPVAPAVRVWGLLHRTTAAITRQYAPNVDLVRMRCKYVGTFTENNHVASEMHISKLWKGLDPVHRKTSAHLFRGLQRRGIRAFLRASEIRYASDEA